MNANETVTRAGYTDRWSSVGLSCSGKFITGQFWIFATQYAAGNVHRSRHALNADTIREMHLAFRGGGRKAIEKVMRDQPAVFLKLLVLLVPREMKLEHSGGIKAMSDEQLERTIEALETIMRERGIGPENAK